VWRETTLLCAIAGDAHARAVTACARAWATATRTRLVFLHTGGSDPERAGARLAADGIAPHELRVLAGDPGPAMVGAIAHERPWLSLIAWTPNGANGDGDAWAELLRQAGSPVGVLPPGAAAAAGPIVCAVSLCDDDEWAVRFSSTLATAAQQPLLVESVLGARDAVREAAARARGSVLVSADNDGAARADALAGRLVDAARRMGAGVLVLAAPPTANGGDLPAQVAQRLRTAAPCLVVCVPP
jgi:hypothetical protein